MRFHPVELPFTKMALEYSLFLGQKVSHKWRNQHDFLKKLPVLAEIGSFEGRDDFSGAQMLQRKKYKPSTDTKEAKIG